MNSGSEVVGAKHVCGKNICWSTCIDKNKERKIFAFLHCPFEPPAKQHRPVSQLGWILWCMLARPSKGQCRNSKIFPPLLLAVKVDQHIFFPETCFAPTISEPEFTMWYVCLTSKVDGEYSKSRNTEHTESARQASKQKAQIVWPLANLQSKKKYVCS